jgi:methylmalonyl-CoA mutase C-terminal domain/subunit
MNPRVVLAKVGLDGHDVGILLLAKRLMESGFEVVYLGKRNRPVDVASAVLQEDAIAAGISSLSGGAALLACKTIEAFKAAGIEDVPLVVGGIAERDEVQAMLDAGVERFCGPHVPLDEVVDTFVAIAARAPA